MNLLRALVLLAIQKCPDDPARPIMGASEVAMTIHGKCAAPLADQKLESIDIEGGRQGAMQRDEGGGGNDETAVGSR